MGLFEEFQIRVKWYLSYPQDAFLQELFPYGVK